MFIKTRMGKLRFTAMAVSTSAKRDNILVAVLYVYLIRQWTLISVSYELFYILLDESASDKSVKDFLRLVTAEQLQARVTPKQVTPFFVDKLTQLCSHLDKN